MPAQSSLLAYGDYAGAGPGAHSRLTRGSRRASPPSAIPKPGCGGFIEAGHGIVEDEKLTAREEASERLLMGLRLAEGVPATALLPPAWLRVRLQELAGRGLLALSPERVSTTAAGRPAPQCGD